MSSSPKHALVFGASGISGWGTIVQLTSYPTKETFAGITGLTNRPLSAQNALLPDDNRIELVPGVDLSAPPESVISELEARVPHIADITTVFFYAYIHFPEGLSVRDANSRLVENAVIALEKLCPNLEHFILQTGGKTYGLEYNLPLPPQPFKESDARSSHTEILENMFYYPQVDIVKKYSEAAPWAWSEIIPDAIIGFAPTSNAMNLARGLAVYFLLWRKVYGKGSEIPFPGGADAWKAAFDYSPMTTIARFSIYAALNSAKTNGKSFNISERETNWSVRWPELAKEFGLVGVGSASDTQSGVTGWVLEHAIAWEDIIAEYGLKMDPLPRGSFDFIDFQLTASVDRVYDNTERFKVGFNEEADVMEAFREAWRNYARRNILPPL